jgi:hypothetical protein
VANEARITLSLIIRKTSGGSLAYQPPAASFTADVNGNKGPTPGALTVTTTGVNVDLSGLTYKGFCRVSNIEDTTATTYVVLGPYDGTNYVPMVEIGPGEVYVYKLYRYLGAEFTGTGTNSDSNTLRLMSVGGSSNVVFEAFER